MLPQWIQKIGEALVDGVQELELAQLNLLHDRLALASPTLIICEAIEPLVFLKYINENQKVY
jgi:hypothetical protein